MYKRQPDGRGRARGFEKQSYSATVSDDGSPLDRSSGQPERIRWIEFLAWWFGRFRRSDLAKDKDVSARRVRDDLIRYADIRFAFAEADSPEVSGRFSEKLLIAPDNFTPTYFKPDSAEFLRWLASVQGLLTPPMAAPAALRLPKDQLDAMPDLMRARPIRPETLRSLVRAMDLGPGGGSSERRQEILVAYTSPGRSGESRFWVGPHALTNDSFRWAVRAWREDRKGYGDLVLDRIGDVLETRSAKRDHASADEDWRAANMVTLDLRPHPGLDADAAAHIADQYGMVEGRLLVPMRRCFVVYFLKRYQIEEVSDRKLPSQQPLFLFNREEVTRLAIPASMRIGDGALAIGDGALAAATSPPARPRPKGIKPEGRGAKLRSHGA